jgi:hypothetical protein
LRRHQRQQDTTPATGAGSDEVTSETCKLLNTTAMHSKEALSTCVVSNPVFKMMLQLGKENGLETITPKESNFIEFSVTGRRVLSKANS